MSQDIISKFSYGYPFSHGGGRRHRDYTPLSWEKYFDKKDDITVNGTDVSYYTHTAFNIQCFAKSFEVSGD